MVAFDFSYFSFGKLKYLVSLLLLSLAGGIIQTDAATLQTFKVGGWSAGAYSDDASHKFSHCAGTTIYNSGIFVTLIINKKYQWGVSFSHPSWNLTPGAKIDLAYVVDNGEPHSAVGSVINSKQVLIGFGGDAKGFAKFSHGYVLRVAAAQKVFSFNLTNTSKLLPALLNCVNTRMNPAPLVTRTNTPSSNAEIKAEAAVVAANLLSQAGISGFHLATPGELPELKADAIWIAKDVIGTINIMPNIKTKDLDEVRSILIGADAKSCKGTFFSGSIADSGDQNNQLTRVFTTCQTKDTPITTYYLATSRKAGGMYILSTISSGLSEKPAKEADGSIRKAVFTAISR